MVKIVTDWEKENQILKQAKRDFHDGLEVKTLCSLPMQGAQV